MKNYTYEGHRKKGEDKRPNYLPFTGGGLTGNSLVELG